MRLGNKRALGSVLTTISSLFVEKDAVTPDQDFLLSADNLPHEYPGIARSAPSLKSKSYGNFEPHADYGGYKPPGHNLHEGNTALSTVMRLGLLPDGVPVWISSLLSEITPETFVLVAILHILVLFYVERIGKWSSSSVQFVWFLGKIWFSLLIIIILFNYYKVFFSLFQFVRDIIWYHSCYLLSRASFWFYTGSVWTPWGVAACSPSGQASLPTRSCLLPVMLSRSTVTGALMMSERRLTLSAWLLRVRLSFRGGTILSCTV